MDTNCILTGDCVELFKRITPGSIDLVFADPPFNIKYEYDYYKDNLPRGDYLEWNRQWMNCVWDALKPGGTFWLAIGDEYAAELKVVAQETAFQPKNWVIWSYDFGVYCTKKFGRNHTHLLYFVKPGGEICFNDLDIRVPSARQAKYNDKRAVGAGRIPGDVWNFPRVCGTFKERDKAQSCQMPERVLERIILTSSRPQEIVLDPFVGSGTTAAVAKKLDRQFIGFELSEASAARARARVESVAVGDPIAGSLEPVS